MNATMLKINPRLTADAMTVAWKPGTRVPVAAEVAYGEVRRLSRSGEVTAARIVEAAAAKDAPLHPCFEWDDGVAAARHREAQARQLLGKLIVVTYSPEGEPRTPTRYMVHLTPREDHEEDAPDSQGYLAVTKVMADADLRRRYVQQAFREAVAWRERYRDIQELATIHAAIDHTAERMNGTA